MKISELTQATRINDNDLLHIVQDGQNKKVKAGLIYKEGDAIDASSLAGVDADEFVTKQGGKNMADGLGGLPASDFATKNYVDGKLGVGGGATATQEGWCAPIMWFDRELMPDGLTPSSGSKWRPCDGQPLNVSDYPELFSIIGHKFTRTTSGEVVSSSTEYFNIPDMGGRMPIGAVATIKTTENLPSGLYHSDDVNMFDESGQWRYPQEVGLKGGDPTSAMCSEKQLPWHSHGYSQWDGDLQNVSNNGSGAYAHSQKSNKTTETSIAGENYETLCGYPHNPTSGNHAQAMLSISPYLSFVFVMKVKP
jgi:microcystin-dependent protein